MMYSLRDCHFCGSDLDTTTYIDYFFCYCENEYAVALLGEDKYETRFVCGDYKFYIYQDSSDIIDMSHFSVCYGHSKIHIDAPLLITKDNYLSMIDRVKKLVIFS